MKLMLIATVMAVGLSGCEIPVDSKQPNESTVAQADLPAYRYVQSHHCIASYRVEAGDATFQYSTGTAKLRSARTGYQCESPKVFVLVDDAPMAGLK